jgi:SAM-dependent methyltransferase
MIETVRGRCPQCGPEFLSEPWARGPDYEYRTTGAEEFTFVRCRGCGILVLDPRPSDAESPGLYPPDYEPYRFSELPGLVRVGREFVQYRKVRALLDWARPEARIVDVGCGAGSTLLLLRKFGPVGLRLVGWDFPGPHLARLAAAGIETIGAPIDGAHAPKFVDVFVLNQVLEHFPEPDRVLAALHGALRPGGAVFIETPDSAGLDARWFRSGFWGGYHIPRHFVIFDQTNLRSLVESTGFRVERTAHLPSPAFWIQSLHHIAEQRGHERLRKLCSIRNLPLLGAFTAWDLLLGSCLPTSTQRLVARRM